MRFPMTHSHALIICRLVNNNKLARREMNPFDMVALTQVGAIKMTNNKNKNNGLVVTKSGMKRFLKWYRKSEMVTSEVI